MVYIQGVRGDIGSALLGIFDTARRAEPGFACIADDVGAMAVRAFIDLISGSQGATVHHLLYFLYDNRS
jgi:hypothetical protein